MISARIRRYRTLGAFGVVSMLCAVGCAASEQDADADADADAIVVFGPYRRAEADRLVDSLQEYSAKTGVTIRYTGSTDFVSDLNRRIGSADAPDIALIPQPGLVAQLIDDREILPLDAATTAQLANNYDPDVRAIGNFGGLDYAVPFRRTLKSVVWFRRDVFEAENWALPTTLDELEELSVTIAGSDRGISPWCFALNAGDATGWAATDWVEDLVLRRQGPEFYDEWAAGTVDFAHPAIAAVFAEFRQLVLGPGRVDGGVADVISQRVDRAWEPLLKSEPGCAMYRQADFAIGWMPAGTNVGPDESLDWFLLPDAAPGTAPGSTPLVIGGDGIVQFNDRREVAGLMSFLASADAGTPWARSGGFLSAKSSISEDEYPGVEKEFIALLATSDIQVFDASDQMHPDIGSGLLWAEITKWVGGAISYNKFAETIDTARSVSALS
jgi:alpha-glucoside transport system substrate-binding protein